jgi:NAD(P)-dependent dehydrogenase (short-subunit alcohol dehydrogenase family)
MSFTRYGSLEGRTVIITGGASGIGASFVRAFVENGAKVAFLDQQRETGAALADSHGEGAARPLFLPCDLADIAALAAGPSPTGAVCARSGAPTRAARSDWSTRANPLPRWRSAMGHEE